LTFLACDVSVWLIFVLLVDLAGLVQPVRCSVQVVLGGCCGWLCSGCWVDVVGWVLCLG